MVQQQGNNDTESATEGPGPYVPAGWTAEGWMKRLRYLAGVAVREEVAADLLEQAAAIEAELPTPMAPLEVDLDLL